MQANGINFFYTFVLAHKKEGEAREARDEKRIGNNGKNKVRNACEREEGVMEFSFIVRERKERWKRNRVRKRRRWLQQWREFSPPH